MLYAGAAIVPGRVAEVTCWLAPTAPRPPRILWPRRPRRAAPVGRLLRERSNRLSGRDAGETRVCRDNVQPLRTDKLYVNRQWTNSPYYSPTILRAPAARLS